MRSKSAFLFCCVATMVMLTEFASAQIIGGGGDSVSVFATNNSGFVQTGLNGPDNLVLFDLPTVEPKDPAVLPPITFTIVGNLESDFDLDKDGANDSLGTFSGLEWSTGVPGVGTLIGCVLNEGNGGGEFYQIDPNSADTLLIGQSPAGRDFSDLAFNPADGLMYGLMNDIIDDGNGDLDFGPNTLWVDFDGDLVPETQVGSGPNLFGTDPFCLGQLATLASGLAFDANGVMYVYDNVNEVLLAGGVNSGNPAASPCAVGFEGNDTGLDNTETAQGNGLTFVPGFLLLSTDVPIFGNRNTIVSYYPIPMIPPMEPPPVTNSGMFNLDFFQTGFQAEVAVGDLVGAMADLDDLPPTFPDTLIVNHGIPAKDAVLEGVVLSDDFRYCITAEAPVPNAAPVDITVIFTIPNAANVTVLGVEVESNANTPNIEHSFSVANVNTQLFEPIGDEAVTVNSDGTIDIDLTLGIDDYLNPQTGQLIVRIGSVQNGPVMFFPWQIKYDNIIAVSD